MAKCEICGKVPMFGHKVSHSNRATNRQFRPNIQHKRIQVNGAWRHIYVCTRCLRTLSRGEQ